MLLQPYSVTSAQVSRFSYISIDIDAFSIQNVSFLDISKNKVIHGTFSNLIYTNPNVTFNGLYLNIPSCNATQLDNTADCNFHMKRKVIERIPFRSKADNWRNHDAITLDDNSIDLAISLIILHNLDTIELEIIEYYKIFFNIKKTPSYQLKSYFRDAGIKNNFALISSYESIPTTANNFFISSENTIILKISGIWETKTHVGINFKFMKTWKN